MFDSSPTQGFMSRFNKKQPVTNSEGLLSSLTGGKMMMPNRRPNRNQMMPLSNTTGGGFDLGRMTGGNTSITGGIMGRQNPDQPLFSTMPIPQSSEQYPFMNMPQPTPTPMEDSQLWKAYNRLSGGQMQPRMLL